MRPVLKGSSEECLISGKDRETWGYYTYTNSPQLVPDELKASVRQRRNLN